MMIPIVIGEIEELKVNLSNRKDNNTIIANDLVQCCCKTCQSQKWVIKYMVIILAVGLIIPGSLIVVVLVRLYGLLLSINEYKSLSNEHDIELGAISDDQSDSATTTTLAGETDTEEITHNGIYKRLEYHLKLDNVMNTLFVNSILIMIVQTVLICLAVLVINSLS